MFLKRLELSGFKSFGGKVKLDLEPGITAIVGPNGSGKSNIADAIRWALGEQSVRQLRLKKNEEIVFAGTDKRARASLAEVSLLLDNSDAGLEIDFSEVQLSRLLYRDGDSEYRLNGAKVRLNEVQQLLAQAGFGTNSYSVIGQGMIDGFILATPTERKLLFDEASGIRQYELRREKALKQLESTEQNLVRARDVLGELEPRLKTLERMVEAESIRQELVADLSQKRRVLIASAKGYFSTRSRELKQQIAQQQAEIKLKQSQVTKLETERDKAHAAQSTVEAKKRSAMLNGLEVERDSLGNTVSVKRAELQFLKERQLAESNLPKVADIQIKLSKAKDDLQTSKKDLKVAKKNEEAASLKIDEVSTLVQSAQSRLSKLRRANDDSSRLRYVTHALALLKQLYQSLGAKEMSRQQLRLSIYKAGRMLSHASSGQDKALNQIKELQNQLTTLMKQREELHDKYTDTAIGARSLELDVSHYTERVEHLEAQLEAARTHRNGAVSLKALTSRQSELDRLEGRLEALAPQIERLRTELSTAQITNVAESMFELAARLETAKTELARTEDTQASLRSQSQELESEALRYDRLAKSWFGPVKVEATVSSKPLHELEREVEILEARAAADAPANQEALEEYQDVRDRVKFLSEQSSDLDRAKSDLSKVISQLEGLIKDRFESAFAEIKIHFSDYFNRLFDGGKADLVLTQEAGSYGIEIRAVPPGKRVESLAVLSGGERAMTGIALLGAILRVNPSPFVVMDEVDAALDEANSTRFADILDELSQNSQLLVITHNRQTMQAAHSLFGVTMDENHVSRLLSVRLSEARELAEA